VRGLALLVAGAALCLGGAALGQGRNAGPVRKSPDVVAAKSDRLGSLVVIMRDTTGVDGLVGVQVTITGHGPNGGRQAWTDSAGVARFDSVLAGTVKLKVDRTLAGGWGCFRSFGPVAVRAFEADTARFTFAPCKRPSGHVETRAIP
jgi:hypothetical protein